MSKDYALEILKNHLKNEKIYKSEHQKALDDKDGNVSDRRAYIMSVRLAEKRIPSLEDAIKKLI